MTALTLLTKQVPFGTTPGMKSLLADEDESLLARRASINCINFSLWEIEKLMQFVGSGDD